jgi:hypothetical protein
LEFLECQTGYQELEKLLSKLAQHHGKIHFHIRVDAASQYATNLLAFLHRLPWSKTISVGEPRRNKQYREVHFPKRKADATESHACARFAIVERPLSSATVDPEVLALRKVASRLEFQVKQSTRLVNRLHNLLSRVFPELATLQNDLQARWVLRLLEKYPTAERIAKARLSSVTGIPRLPSEKGQQVHQAAAQSVAAERGAVIEEVVRESVRALQASLDAEKRLDERSTGYPIHRHSVRDSPRRAGRWDAFQTTFLACRRHNGQSQHQQYSVEMGVKPHFNAPGHGVYWLDTKWMLAADNTRIFDMFDDS